MALSVKMPVSRGLIMRDCQSGDTRENITAPPLAENNHPPPDPTLCTSQSLIRSWKISLAPASSGHASGTLAPAPFLQRLSGKASGPQYRNATRHRHSNSLVACWLFWFRLPPATKAPRGRPYPRRSAEENGKNQAETGGSG